MKRRLQVILGVLIGVGLLWFLFRGTDWGEVVRSIRSASIFWLVMTQVPIWASFFARIRRWHFIVRSAGPVPFRTLFTATQIGFLANFVLPLRVGELVRAFLLARRTGLRFTRCVALVALDRVADIFGLLACAAFAVAAMGALKTVELPPGTFGNDEVISVSPLVIQSGTLLALGMLVAASVVLVLLYVRQSWILRTNDRVVGMVSTRLAAKLHGLLDHFAQGLHVFRSPSDMARAVGWSIAVWGSFVLAAACTLNAFDFDYRWYTPFLMQVLLAVAVMAPGAPGFVGQFHLAVVVAIVMTMPGVDPSQAKAVALVAHLLNVLPVVVAGVIGLGMENAGLLELTRETAEAEAQVEAETATERAE